MSVGRARLTRPDHGGARRCVSKRFARISGKIQGAFMKSSNSNDSQASPNPTAPRDSGFSPWQRLKTKRISYLTLPLLMMATVTEFVILATGWKYQQVVCLPQGM